MLRKAKATAVQIPESVDTSLNVSEKERGLIQLIADFKEVVEQAAQDYSPSGIANYIYELVKEYNQFYHDFSILGEDDMKIKQFRLVLSQTVGETIKNGMDLLGIEVPDRM